MNARTVSAGEIIRIFFRTFLICGKMYAKQYPMILIFLSTVIGLIVIGGLLLHLTFFIWWDYMNSSSTSLIATSVSPNQKTIVELYHRFVYDHFYFVHILEEDNLYVINFHSNFPGVCDEDIDFYWGKNSGYVIIFFSNVDLRALDLEHKSVVLYSEIYTPKFYGFETQKELIIDILESGIHVDQLYVLAYAEDRMDIIKTIAEILYVDKIRFENVSDNYFYELARQKGHQDVLDMVLERGYIERLHN